MASAASCSASSSRSAARKMAALLMSQSAAPGLGAVLYLLGFVVNVESSVSYCVIRAGVVDDTRPGPQVTPTR
jgi:hypothetical protein